MSEPSSSSLLLVLGMHRSGTSCLTGLLEDIGLSPGQVDCWGPFNRKGNREDARVNQLNDALLQTDHFAWDVPPPLSWHIREETLPSLRARRGECVNAILAQAPLAILKDPRTLLTLPFWCEMQPEPRLMGIFRHPWSVAHSVAVRDMGQSVEEGLALWLAYNERLLQAHRRRPFPLLCFDLPHPAFVQQLSLALRTHFADWIEAGMIHLDRIGAFYDQSLVHQAPAGPEGASGVSEAGLRLLERAMLLYRTLCELANVAPVSVDAEPVDPMSQLAFWLQQAEALREAGQLEAELALCQKALAHVADRAPLWRRILRLRQTLGNKDELIVDLHRISQEHPDEPDLLAQGGEWLESQGAHEAAIQILNLAVERVPQWWRAQLSLGRCWMKLKRPELAFPHLDQTHRLVPSSGAVHIWLMECHGQLGRRSEAEAHYAEALKRLPFSQLAWLEHSWAEVLSSWGEREKALEHRQRAVNSPHVLPHMVVAFAQDLLALGQREQARQVLSSAQATGMQSPQLTQWLIRCQA